MNKNIRLTVLLIIFLLGGFFLGQSLQTAPKTPAPQVQQQQEAKQVSFMFVMDDTTLVTAELPWKENFNLLDATKEIATAKELSFETKDYGDMGTLVTQIGKRKNGEGAEYWQFWVNNEQIQVAADKYILNPGDVISWQFRKSAY